MVIIVFNLSAQSDSICGILPIKKGIVTFENVIKVDSSSAKTLYNGTKLWIAKTFVSSKAVINSDVDNSIISISAYLVEDIVCKYSFRMEVQFKDNRFKYIISDIVIHLKFSGSSQIDTPIELLPAAKECKKKTLIEIRDKFLGIVNNLSNSLNSKSDNW